MSTATAVRVIGRMNREVVVDSSGEGDSDGIVTYEWVTADTDSTGEMEFEVEIMWPDAKPQTVRVSGTLPFRSDFA